jgi:hypothetical protein
MSPEERQMIAGLFDRVRDAERAPRDREAEAYIADRAREAPNAAYTLAQVVLVQEQALGAAQRRIDELEAALRDTQARADVPAQQGGFLGGLGSLFGGGAPARPSGPSWNREPGLGAPPRQGGGPGAYAPPGGSNAFGAPPPAGPWGRAQPEPATQARGGSFLAGALTTAAGVAGGMLLANSIQGLFRSDPQLSQTAGLSSPAGEDAGASGVWPGDGQVHNAGEQDGGFQDAGFDHGRDAGGYDDGGYDEGGFDGDV